MRVGTASLDKKDRDILALLEVDARRSNAEIGRATGLSPPAVAERIAKLKDAGVLKGFTAIIDPERINRPVAAFIEFRPSAPDDQRIVERISRFSEITDCYRVSGSAFLVLIARVQSNDRLNDLLMEMRRFGETETSIILATDFERRPYFAKHKDDFSRSKEKACKD